MASTLMSRDQLGKGNGDKDSYGRLSNVAISSLGLNTSFSSIFAIGGLTRSTAIILSATWTRRRSDISRKQRNHLGVARTVNISILGDSISTLTCKYVVDEESIPVLCCDKFIDDLASNFGLSAPY